MNTTISGINIAEGCAPSGINNAIRQLMADVKAEKDARDAELSANASAQSTKDSQQDSAIQQAQTAANNAASAAAGAQNTANTAKSGADTANAAVAGLATVAKTGSYNDLSNKPAIPAAPKAYITETWVSGTSWYHKYSNGWIEQGGVLTNQSTNGASIPVTLHKEMANTNYVVKLDRKNQANNITTNSQLASNSYTTTTFTIGGGYNGGMAQNKSDIVWEVKGYAK
jgi:hypothetical protein